MSSTPTVEDQKRLRHCILDIHHNSNFTCLEKAKEVQVKSYSTFFFVNEC
jgi:hypothetical protein